MFVFLFLRQKSGRLALMFLAVGTVVSHIIVMSSSPQAYQDDAGTICSTGRSHDTSPFEITSPAIPGGYIPGEMYTGTECHQ